MAVRLAGVYAHPDDDTYGLAATLALEGPDRVEYALVVATSGEAGLISDPALATRDTLARVREAEERAALAVVGFADAPIHFLRYPDGGLKGVPRQEVVDRIAEILRAFRPHVVATFGPEGITRHDDHVSVSQAATEAFHGARADVGDERVLRALYYSAMPRSSIEALWRGLRARGVEVGDPEGPFMPRGVPDETIAVRVDGSRVVKRKIEAIRAHRTQQVELEYLPQDLQPELLAHEWFVQAWPPSEGRTEPVRDSLFDGVEG
jgi:LmbE family N-acetylglucosaminyl deacetylase